MCEICLKLTVKKTRVTSLTSFTDFQQVNVSWVMRYKNKDQQQLQQTHPTDIIEVEQSDTDIPDEIIFLTKLVIVLRQEKGIYRKN